MKKIILLLVYMILFTLSVYAISEYKTFEYIDRSNGLSNDAISSMIQDKYGFIWVGTQGGLNRYDGNNTIVFRADPFDDNSLANNLIQTLYYDEVNHELWIGTYQGVSRFVINEEKFYNYTVDSHGLSNAVITSIIKDKGGDIWLGTLGGLDKLEIDNDKVTNYEVEGHVVRDIHIASNGQMYIGTYTGLYVFKEDLRPVDLDLASPYVMAIAEDQDHLILGLYDGGVAFYNFDDQSLKSRQYSDNRVYTLMALNDELWVGTWGGGLFVDSESDLHHYPGTKDEQDIRGAVVYSLLEDDSGIVWLGTNGGGISRWHPNKKHYSVMKHDSEQVNSLSPGRINVIKNIDDELYIGLYNHGLNIYDEKTGNYRKYNSANSLLNNDGVNDVIDYQDTIILATMNGLYQIKDEVLNFWPLLNDDIIAYKLLTHDDKLYIGTYNAGLFIYDGQLKHLNTDNSDISDNLIYDLEFVEDQLWIGTNDGLNVLSTSGDILTYKKHDQESHYMSSNKIQCIHLDTNDNLWFGTAGGGIIYYDMDHETFEVFTEREGLASNDVSSITEDHKGYLWLGTNDGLSRIHLQTKDIVNYTPFDGIGGWQFTRGSYVDKSGNIYVGGNHGITRIPSTIETTKVSKPLVYVTNTSIEDTSLKDSIKIYNNQSFDVSYNESYLAFDVVTIDYDSSDKTHVSYFLEGHDDKWIQLGANRRISYSKLSPGNYTLFVKAVSDRGHESELVQVFLYVERPLYQHPLMFILYVLLALFAFFFFLRIRDARLTKKKNEELEDLNNTLETMNNTLESLAIKDPLTGIYNRRYFKTTLEEYIELAKRSSSFVTIMMVDLDDFKNINDQYGHLSGDRILTLLSERLTSVLVRKTDFLSRYGGDEFSVVLYDTDLDGTKAIAHRLLRVCDECFNIDDQCITVNISIGVSHCIPGAKDTFETLMKQADYKLYQAKSMGKNQISY